MLEMCWKNIVRLVSFILIFAIVANIVQYWKEKGWDRSGKKKNYFGLSSAFKNFAGYKNDPKNVKWAVPITDNISNIDQTDPSYSDSDYEIIDINNDIDKQIDDLVPEYVEEMNDYQQAQDADSSYDVSNNNKDLGNTIADVYDNLTRAPDISQGRDVKMISDSGIGAFDSFASGYSTY